MSETKRGGARRKKVVGVCAVCRVDARPAHFHTPSHLAAAARWDRAHHGDQNEPKGDGDGEG